jgi:peptide chain release factor 3
MGSAFEGLYDFERNALSRPVRIDAEETAIKVDEVAGFADAKLDTLLTSEGAVDLRENGELAQLGYPAFDGEAYRNGDLTPVYFGSALKDFGVADLIDAIARFAPSPRTQPAQPNDISPDDTSVTGFVFKVQANMNPMHRDRVAFMRLCSGKFTRGMKLNQMGTGKSIAIHSPILFFARDRETAEEAFPGDIIGIPNHGTLRVGDTLTDGPPCRIIGLPNFAPELLRRVVLKDPTKTKQLRKALDDLAEEGITQVFYPDVGGQWIIGVVGALQLDVLISRLEAEYKVDAALEPSPWNAARWISGDQEALKQFASLNRAGLATDRDGARVFMATDSWNLSYVEGKNAAIQFSATKERN